MKPRIVVSGVNLVEAGPISIFQDALTELSSKFTDRYDIVALVHKATLFSIPGVTYLEFPFIKRSWIRRVWFEYVQCKFLSEQLAPYLWLAMHDMTPNVHAKIRAVYCHNPSPFYSASLKQSLTDLRMALFSVFYQYLYAINIRRNDFVVVQQQWIRAEFVRRYGVSNVVVAHPSIPEFASGCGDALPRSSKKIFLYPAFPRSFKNAELLLEAAEMLELREPGSAEVWITMRGDENRYAKELFRRFGHMPSVRWTGFQSRERVSAMYAAADCLVFPSRLETWGMPISEFKQTGKQMIVADLPYAHETVGSYDAVEFVSLTDAAALAERMQAFVRGTLVPHAATAEPIEEPFATDWNQLFRILLGEVAPH